LLGIGTMTSSVRTIEHRTPDHFCPGCGKQLSYGPRTPWRFCGGCIDKATDARGNKIRFIGMGSEWCYAQGHGPNAHDNGATGVICLVMGRPVIVHEARQGGVAAEPLYPWHLSPLQSSAAGDGADRRSKGIVDLTCERTLDAMAAERLVRPGREVRY